jgi:hypothetical protein
MHINLHAVQTLDTIHIGAGAIRKPMKIPRTFGEEFSLHPAFPSPVARLLLRGVEPGKGEALVG